MPKQKIKTEKKRAKFKIAVVQMQITHLLPDLNFVKIEKFIKRAVKQNADVIIFPEDSMTCSIFGDKTKISKDDSFLNHFKKLAQKYHIDIISGSWMEMTPNGSFNTTHYIDASGNVLGTYHKNHLYLSERHFLDHGTKVTVFDTRFGRAGLVIVWDIMFPEIFSRMNELGVEIVYCPSYWYDEISGTGRTINPQAEAMNLDAICLSRAIENNIAFVYANAAGVMTFPHGTVDHLVGHSQITMPIVGAIAKIKTNREKMFVQEINMSVLDVSDENYKIRRLV